MSGSAAASPWECQLLVARCYLMSASQRQATLLRFENAVGARELVRLGHAPAELAIAQHRARLQGSPPHHRRSRPDRRPYAAGVYRFPQLLATPACPGSVLHPLRSPTSARALPACLY